jgi:hypothetical protein
MDETFSRYNFTTDTVELVPNQTIDRPIFKVRERGYPDDTVEWRSIRWSRAIERFVGQTFFGEFLFSWDPQTGDIEVLDRIAIAPIRKSGEIMRASLAFELSQDGRTVYYVNGAAPGFEGNKGTNPDPLHLVTFDLIERRYTDHGSIRLEDGRAPDYCQGLEIGRDGNLYLVCNIPFTDLASEKGRMIRDLHYSSAPIETLKNAYEVNLVVLKNPVKE